MLSKQEECPFMFGSLASFLDGARQRDEKPPVTTPSFLPLIDASTCPLSSPAEPARIRGHGDGGKGALIHVGEMGQAESGCPSCPLSSSSAFSEARRERLSVPIKGAAKWIEQRIFLTKHSLMVLGIAIVREQVHACGDWTIPILGERNHGLEQHGIRNNTGDHFSHGVSTRSVKIGPVMPRIDFIEKREWNVGGPAMVMHRRR
ncbi:hypothetical protein WN55_06564 [Dufourea novaeangliae]|uniref:Uncharacterized protein n=1 Tax=Dufourea novaeangliae TaxID=178035 RepID=A0A154PQ76_DUFNO|nr:hypothetical protein WN55_06564 [Dufourea novaeangliae]